MTASVGVGARLADGLVRHATWVLLLALVLGAGAAARLFDDGRFALTVDPSLASLLPRAGADKAVFDRFVARYPSDDLLLVAFVDDGLFTPAGLAALARFGRAVERLPGVEHVEGLHRALRTLVRDGFSEVEPYLDHVPADAAGIAALRADALADPTLAGYLVSADGTGAVVAVRFSDALDAARQIALVRHIDALSRTLAGDLRRYLSGPLYVRLEMSRLLLLDLARVMPLAVAASLIVVALGCRRLHALVLPPLANLLAVAATLALFVAAGHRLSYVTVLLAPTVYVVGFAYALYIVTDFERWLAQGLVRSAALGAALRDTAWPVACAALTTVLGFLSLTFSSIDSIRLFGLYAAVGTAFAAVGALCVVPAGLARWPGSISAAAPSHRGAGAPRRLAALATLPGPVLPVVIGALVVGAVIGALRIEVGTDYLSNFAPGSAVRRQFEELNARFAGAVPLQVLLQADEVDTFKRRAALRALADLEVWLEAQPEIGGVYSLLDYLAVIERTLTPEAVDDDRVPESDALTSDLLLIGANEDVERFADRSFRSTLVQMRVRAYQSADLNALSARIEARLAALPSGLRGEVTGTSWLVARTLDDITRGQLLSLAGSALPILLVLALLLRSPMAGLLALLPNLLPLLAFFGVLGWLGVTLNLTTSLIAAVVLGIAVDDSIHLLVRLRGHLDHGQEPEAAVRATLAEVIRPVTLTSAGLALGFLTMATGELSSQSEFGLLAALALILAWLLDLTVTPALGLRVLRGRAAQHDHS